jgi:hypothetical protein
VVFDKIAAFGDSWVWGDELVDPNMPNATPDLLTNQPYRESHCFAGVIARHYQVPVENFAIPGGSLQSTIWNYLWWLNNRTDHDSTLVLVGLTDASRQSWYNPSHVVYANDPNWNRYVHSAWVHSTKCYNDDWRALTKYYMTLSDCQQLWKNNYQQALLFFDGQRHRHSLIQFNLLKTYPEFSAPSLIFPDSNLRQLLSAYSNCWAPQRHPNEHGHQVIADLLISQIDSAIITRC